LNHKKLSIFIILTSRKGFKLNQFLALLMVET